MLTIGEKTARRAAAWQQQKEGPEHDAAALQDDNFTVQIHRDRQCSRNEAAAGCGQRRQAPAGQVHVELSRELLAELRAFGQKETRREVGALLLGQITAAEKGPFGPFVTVEAWLEAKYAENQCANITFTHRTWEYLAEQQEKHYPRLKVVGWFHTHPGFGIFLSRYDLFIHKNFFRDPGQVALVYDPLKESTGIFCWQDGEIQPGEYRLVDPGPRPRGGEAPGENSGAAAEFKSTAKDQPADPTGFFMTLLLLLGTMLGALLLMLYLQIR